MAFDPCDVCSGCVPANIEPRAFHQMALVALCQIVAAIEGGGGVADNVNISAYGGVATTLGQKTMAASMPVVIASDQSAVPVSGTVTVGNGVGAAAVNIQDGGNSITVDGSVGVTNGAGVAAVNIQDGGNSITVDGIVTQTAATAGTQTETFVASSGAGSVAAGAYSASISNVGVAAATVLGVSVPPGSTVNFAATYDPVTNIYKYLPAIAYDGTGTTLNVLREGP